jgi:general stress protein YciG
MAIKTAPIEAVAPSPKQPRKATAKPAQVAPVAPVIQSTAEPVKAAVEASKADGRKRSGFASMTADQHRQASARGGAAQPKDKRYFAANKDAARLAGAKGGKHSPKKEAKSDGI